jgi:shikimate kinase
MDEKEKEVMKDYEQSLIFPPQPPRKQFVLCPVGLIGAGKTTVTQPLADRLSLLYLSGDEIRKRLKERGMSYEALSRIRPALIRNYLNKGFSLAVDSDCAGMSGKEIRAAIEKSKVIPIYIHINPPEPVILGRLRERHQQPDLAWLFKDANEAVANYMRRKPLHEHLDLPFVFTFDDSKEGLASQLDECESCIRKIVEQ